MVPRELGLEGIGWIYLAQDRHMGPLVNMGMHFSVQRYVQNLYLEQLSDYQFIKKDSASCS
jgi:hypothetical protein